MAKAGPKKSVVLSCCCYKPLSYKKACRSVGQVKIEIFCVTYYLNVPYAEIENFEDRGLVFFKPLGVVEFQKARHLLFFFYKNTLYKNKQAQNDPKFKNRTTPASKYVKIFRTTSLRTVNIKIFRTTSLKKSSSYPFPAHIGAPHFKSSCATISGTSKNEKNK